MSKEIRISFSLLLTLSVSSLTFATDDSLAESTSSVKEKIRTMSGSIPVTPPQHRAHSSSDPVSAAKIAKSSKRTLSVSLFSKDKESESSNTSASSSSSSPRSKSLSKPVDTLIQTSSSPRLRGFSYTSSMPGSPRNASSSATSSTTPDSSKTVSTSTVANLPEASKPASPKRERSKSFTSSKKDLVLSRPSTPTALVTSKDPEIEIKELLQKACEVHGKALEPIAGTSKDSNEKIDLVVKPVLDELGVSIKNVIEKQVEIAKISDPKERIQQLREQACVFRMTVKRAESDVFAAVKWALGESLEHNDLVSYFTTMLDDAKKTQETIISEQTQTRHILMTLSQGLYLPLVEKFETQKSQQLEGRTLVVDHYLREYTNYMNSMDDRLKQAIGKPVSFNTLNREFNSMIKLMYNELLKILDWAIGKEEGIDSNLIEQMNKKLQELTIV